MYQTQINAQTADVIREASLRNRADETTKFLREAHETLDRLEDALQGPQPRGGDEGKPGDPGHPGLRP